MVLIKSPIKKVLVPLAIGSLMILDGCNKDDTDPSNTDLLIGDWKMIQWDDDDEIGNYDYSSYLFKFKKSGEWQFCYEYTYDDQTYGDCNTGNWRWESAEETSLIISEEPTGNYPPAEFRFDIVVLTALKLEGNLSVVDYPDYTASMKFIKVK
jgi:hypothetical protein